MASYDPGYDDERFQHPVGQSFHCGICYNVVKDPAMCRHNEHLFCRACITRRLMDSQKCPSCLEPLTVDTLNQPSRTVMNLLSELKIRCQFFNRGCERFIELGNLDRHVTDCGFAPAVCSNEGCRLEVNKQELLHHETAVCELRRVKCHSCNDIRQEMDTVKVNMAAVNERLKEVGEKLDRNETNVKAIKGDVIAKVQEQLNKQQESNRQLEADNVEMKKSLNEITKQLGRLTQQTSVEVQADQEHEKKEIAEAHYVDREPKVVVSGGNCENVQSNSVEMFSLTTRTWTPLQRMKDSRSAASSVVHNNHIFVTGGFLYGEGIKSVERLSINAVHVDQSIIWENFPGELPWPLWGHCSVVYNGRLIVIGGRAGYANSDRIIEVSLVPPYTSKVLATMPQKKWYHCAVLFGSHIVILGGREDADYRTTLKTVLCYNITVNACTVLASLPYAVNDMAAVKWGDDNVIIMGGADINEEPLNKALMYNVKTQKSRTLPDMKYKRRGCVAAVVRDTVIVMGGKDEVGRYLKSVESFTFHRFTWEELPAMLEAGYHATAVVC